MFVFQFQPDLLDLSVNADFNKNFDFTEHCEDDDNGFVEFAVELPCLGIRTEIKSGSWSL